MDNKGNLTLEGQLSVKIIKSGPFTRLTNKLRKEHDAEVKQVELLKIMRG